MIATLHYARKWLRPVALMFVVGQCLRVYWLSENAVSHSGVGGSRHSVCPRTAIAVGGPDSDRGLALR